MGSLKKIYPKNPKAHRTTALVHPEISLMPPPLAPFELTDENTIVSIHIPIKYREFLDIGYNFVRNIVAMAYLQTFDRWELKLIDDPDGQLDLHEFLNEVETFLDFEIDRTKISYMQAFNCNLGIKRNTLINMTTAPIVANWDDDDIYLEDYLKEAVEFFQYNPLQVGIFAGKRAQYNMVKQHCIRWHRKYCNGAAYYVLRKELLDKFPFIRYNTTRMVGEEQDIIKNVRANINRSWSNQETVCKGCDDNYIRMRYAGNLTHLEGRTWIHDLEIQQQYGGDFIEDEDFEWLLKQIPECFHDFYKELGKKIEGAQE